MACFGRVVELPCVDVEQEADATEVELGQLMLTSGDCAKLMPDGSPAEAARVAELEAHLKVQKTTADPVLVGMNIMDGTGRQ